MRYSEKRLTLNQRTIPLRTAEPEQISSVHAMRTEYFLTNDDNELLRAYKQWVSIPLWLLFQRVDLTNWTKKIFAVRGMKRGDKKHAYIASSSFNRALRLKELHRLQTRTKKSPARTNTLLISLTYSGNTGSEAYDYVGKDFNRFISALRKAFRRIQIVRVWESQERGTPHIHALLTFQDKTWAYEFRRSKKNHRVRKPRIFGYKEIKKYWPYYSDVQAVEDYERTVWYLKKYLTKQLEHKEDKDILACAHQMIYNNHTYYVPNNENINRAIREKNPDLITPISNSNYEHEKDWSYTEFLGTMHSMEPLHRTEIYQIDFSELTNKITAIHYLTWNEVPTDEVIQDMTIQTQLPH